MSFCDENQISLQCNLVIFFFRALIQFDNKLCVIFFILFVSDTANSLGLLPEVLLSLSTCHSPWGKHWEGEAKTSENRSRKFSFHSSHNSWELLGSGEMKASTAERQGFPLAADVAERFGSCSFG